MKTRVWYHAVGNMYYPQYRNIFFVWNYFYEHGLHCGRIQFFCILDEAKSFLDYKIANWNDKNQRRKKEKKLRKLNKVVFTKIYE